MKARTLLPVYLLSLVAIAALIIVKGSAQKTPDTAEPPPAAAEFKITGGRAVFEPLPSTLAAAFSGDKAYAHVSALTEIGPRPPASDGYKAALAYLEKELAALGWTTRRQSFNAGTPRGEITFTNLLARFKEPATPWNRSTPVVIGGHLDSKWIKEFSFVGANDGGSSSGVILELARVLAADPASAAKVELVFFDGEEAIGRDITPTDGLYGSKVYAREMQKRQTQPSVGIVLDLVGDDSRDFYYNPEAPAAFANAVEAAARESGMLTLRKSPGSIIDDHVPLQLAGLPCLHLIGDFMNMPYWHQEGDTMKVIDANALRKTGRTTLRFLASELK